jgi:hypothetical protein
MNSLLVPQRTCVELPENWPAANGSAVPQNTHSAEMRPSHQWLRPQPGQKFTACSR